MDQDPQRVAEELKAVAIQFGLRRVQAFTDTHTVTVEEPGSWEGDHEDLKTEIREFDL